MKTFNPTLSIFFSAFVIGMPVSEAHILLALTGTPGSNVVNYLVSGSMTVDVPNVNAVTSGTGRLPVIQNGDWTSSFARDMGDFLSDYSATLHDDLPLSNGGVTVNVSGVGVIGVWDTIDFDPSPLAGEDDAVFDPTTAINYPGVVMGQTVTLSGGGTFSLETSDPSFDTFEEVFTTGTFTEAINSTDNYSVEIAVVPEPSSFLLVALGSFGAFVLRRSRL